MAWSYHRFPFEDPFEALRNIQDEFSRFVEKGVVAPKGYPPTNLWSEGDNIVATVELPGVNKDDIEVTVLGKELTLRGRRAAEEIPEGAVYHRQERVSGEFSRSIELPFPVDADAVTADFKSGILTLTLPRAAADRPRKVTINH